eukprot:9330675-Pyramimonas_sp.AAC.1
MACLGGSRPPPFYYEIWSRLREDALSPNRPLFRQYGPDGPPCCGACGFAIGGPSPLSRRVPLDVSP